MKFFENLKIARDRCLWSGGGHFKHSREHLFRPITTSSEKITQMS